MKTTNTPPDRVRIALQKSGRLSEDSLDLLRKCGLHINYNKDQLLCRIKELPIDVLLVRDDDIPAFVDSGICDLGIVGENVYLESCLAAEGEGKPRATRTIKRLGFSTCRLAIAVPDKGAIQSIADLADTTIATTYPHLLARFLKEQGITARALEMSGSVEVAPRLKIADAICDIVASGATLAANNLHMMTTVLPSEALLIGPKDEATPEKTAIIARLLARMQGALDAEDSKYIMLHATRAQLSEIIKLLPGAESPTILPLQGRDDMYAVHAVCREEVFWETMEKLKAAGASAILVMPIEKMMA